MAGVNKMVVSNALNDKRRVSPETKARVQQIAKELHYVPNSAARALTTGRTGIIAVICGRLSQPYYANMVDMLEQQIVPAGFNMLLVRTNSEVKEIVSATGNVAVDGAIAVDMLGLVNEFQSDSTIPCVSIGTFERSFVDNVLVDLSAGVKEALSVMVQRGRQRIAYLVTAPIMAHETEVRTKAYLDVMQQEGRKPEIINVATDHPDVVEANLKFYILEHGSPDALLCQNDETAMSAFRVFKDLDYSIPGDVLLAGCDGQHHMRLFDPPLSTVEQPTEEVCKAAWNFLQQRIEQPGLPRQAARFEGKLIIRESLTPLSE